MSYYVRLVVSFPCHNRAYIREVAQRFLEECHFKDSDLPGEREAAWFLLDLSRGGSQWAGHEHGMCVWAIDANHCQANVFVSILRPFWHALFRQKRDEAPLRFHHIVALCEAYERPESSSISAYVIAYDERTDTVQMVRHDALPFAWQGE